MDNDIIDISMSFDNLDNFGGSNKKTNFGGGIELLMNDKKTDSQGLTSDINIDDLNNLENELNNLAAETTEPFHNNFESGLFGIKSNFDDKQSVSFNEEPSIHILRSEYEDQTQNLGNSTTNTSSDAKTWDGYGKFNNIPINPDQKMSSEPKLSKDETLREKFKYLRRLETLEKKGIELTKKYNMDSNLQEMMGEYEMIIAEKEKENSVKFQGNMLSAVINGIEFLNNRFDPFDVRLDGWGEQFSENINDYDEIFSELHDKYKTKAKMSPEIKLLFQLAGGAMMVHMTNTMFKSAMPNMDDIMRQNPELMQQFNQAAVNSMSSTNPGFSGFMNNVISKPEPTPIRTGPPPAPMETQGPRSMPAPKRPGFVDNRPFASNRPDIAASRGDGIDLDDANMVNPNAPMRSSRQSRKEMQGPSDISDILSNLKPTKSVVMDNGTNANLSFTQPTEIPRVEEINLPEENGSTISISELKDLQSEGATPKRSRRRKNTSEKNTISLDI